MLIEQIIIKNFKSIKEADISLNPLTMVVGTNASGKSNLINVFRFISNIMTEGIDNAIALQGGIPYLANASLPKGTPIEIAFSINLLNEGWVRRSDIKTIGLEIEKIYYQFVIQPNLKGSGYHIEKDRLQLNYNCLKINPAAKKEDRYIELNEKLSCLFERKNRGASVDSSSEDMDDETLNLLLGYENFQKNVVQFKRKNYFLSQLCDIPQHQKEKFMREFANADTVRAVEIQCGVLCLQAAIQDYIARYAYPIKVKALISVFKSLLEDVTEFTSLTEQKLKERIAVLGEKEGEREGVRRRKESDAQRKENTEQLKNDADILKADILATSFDFSQFTRIKMAFNSCIESDPNIRKIRQSSGATFTYDEKESIINAMLVTHKRAWSTASSCFQELIAAYNLLLKGKLEYIRRIRDEATRYGLLSNGNYKAKIGYEEKLDDLALDIDHIRSDIENNKCEGHYVISMNPIKYETYEWWQWGKKIKKFFAKDYTKEWVGDRYDLSLLLKELTSMNASFEKRCDSAISTYRTDLEDIKNRMNDLIDGLLTLIEQIDADINEQEAKLVALGEDIGINRQAQEELTLTLTWLTTLNERIKGV